MPKLQYYDVVFNFPGGTPIDGPSAGIAMATGIFSAIYQIPIDHTVAMTGEIRFQRRGGPIGGVIPKIKAAKQAGATTVIIPHENVQSILKRIEGIHIVPVETFAGSTRPRIGQPSFRNARRRSNEKRIRLNPHRFRWGFFWGSFSGAGAGMFS